MSLNQVINNESMEMKPLRLAPEVTLASDAVDLDLLNAFEELQTDGEPDLIVELIDLYLQDAPQRILAIREAADATEWRLLRAAAHNLKGSSANLGVRHVADTCKKLEEIDSEKLSSVLDSLFPQLDREFAEASKALLSERSRRGAR